MSGVAGMPLTGWAPELRPCGTLAAARRHYRLDGPGWRCRTCRQAEQRGNQDRPPRLRRRYRPAPPPYPRDPGRQVREMRHYAGLTQEELAGLLGVIRLTVERWETGRRRPRPGCWPGWRRSLALLLTARSPGMWRREARHAA